jgi:hypothetical protein
MHKLERPSLKLKLELEIPDSSGEPSKKFMVSRALKAKWDQNPQNVTKQILEEIKNYRGSFVGDIVTSLSSIFSSKDNLISEEKTRENDVARWMAQLIETIIFSSIDDDSCIEFMENESIPEWDGSIRELSSIRSEELKNIDIEKVSLLLAPRLKHVAVLFSKKLND